MVCSTIVVQMTFNRDIMTFQPKNQLALKPQEFDKKKRNIDNYIPVFLQIFGKMYKFSMFIYNAIS